MRKILIALLLGFCLTTYCQAGGEVTYTTKKVIDKIEVLEDGQIQIRQATKVYANGVEIAKTYHRHCLAPDATDISKEDRRVRAVANAVWTKEVKADYLAAKKANEAKLK